MASYKARIRLADEPYKIIKWMTANFDKEIGALGVGEFKDGDLFVERLVFPKQTVNGAHVHFKPEDWANVVAELSADKTKKDFFKDFGKICFYWHKHPDGCPGASTGDEEHTFDVFMPEDEKERTHFGFLQTAQATKGDGMIYEGRIELRSPLFCTITDCELITSIDVETEKLCQKIIEDKVTIGNLDHTDQPNTKKPIGFGPLSSNTTLAPITTTKKQSDDFFLDVYRSDGSVFVECSDFLRDWVTSILTNELKDDIAKYDMKYFGNGTVFSIQTKKKKSKEVSEYLSNAMEQIYGKYNSALEKSVITQPLTTQERRDEDFATRNLFGDFDSFGYRY